MNYGFVKVAAAIPHVKVANCEFNTQRIQHLVSEAEQAGAEIICFPELCITAYTCQDLFNSQHLIDKAELSLMQLLESTRTLSIIVIVGMPVACDGMLLNCAVVLGGGKILGAVPKSYLPNYREFYEMRWFTPAAGLPPQTVRLAGQTVTVTAQQIFETMATTGADVVFLNLEMSREQLLARSLSRMIHKQGHSMNAADVLKGYKWTDAQRGFVMEAADEYRSRIAPHFVYNPQGMGCTYQSIGTVLAKYGDAMKAQGRRAPVVVLDYLHIVQSDKKEDAQEIIKSTVQMLKEYAVKYDTFVFALSATNRTSNAAGTITQESSRDSSGIEYTADYLLALNYKALALQEKKDDGSKYKASNPNDMEELQNKSPREMLVQVLKNRMNAAGGKLFLAFDSAHSIFYPMERQDYKAADFYNGDEIETI